MCQSFPVAYEGGAAPNHIMSIILTDTFNDCKISSHRTVLSAVRAQQRHLARVQQANGSNSYLTYGFRYSDGTPVDDWEITQAEMDLDQL